MLKCGPKKQEPISGVLKVNRSIRFQMFAGTLALLALSAGNYLVAVPTAQGFVLFCLVNGACLFAAAAVLRSLIDRHAAGRAETLESYLPDDVVRELCVDNQLTGMHRSSVFESGEALVRLLGEHIQQQNELLRAGFKDSFGETLTATTAQLAGGSSDMSSADLDASGRMAFLYSANGNSSDDYPDEQTLAKLRAELAALQDQFNTDVHLFKKT